MTLRTIQPLLLISLITASTGIAAEPNKAVFRPIALTGWNADVVFEKSKSPAATSFDRPNQRTNDYPLYAWFESGLDDHSDGLPASRRFTSAGNSNAAFELQPYNTNNVLLLSAAQPARTLTLAGPSAYRALLLLVSAGGGDSAVTVQLHFTDDSESDPISFQVPDWWTGYESKEPKTPALAALARSNGQDQFQYEEHGDDGFALYQVEIDLKKPGLESKPIKSISFKKGSGGTTAGVFAISAQSSKVER